MRADSAMWEDIDIADLYRASVTLPVAFESAAEHLSSPHLEIERLTRRRAGKRIKKMKLVGEMIDAIKEVLDADDDSGDA